LSKVKKLQREPLTRRAVQVIRGAILAGEYAAGQRLVEEELANSLGVSRNVVREAFWQIEAQGLVQSDDYKGKSVTALTFADMTELIPLRLSLESLAATWAARNVTHRDAKALLRQAAKFRANMASFSSYAEADFELHEMIWKVAGNRQMAMMLDRIAGPMIALQARVYQPRLDELLRKENEAREGSHVRIVQAICNRAAAKARLAMQKHILAFWQLWLKEASAAEADNPGSREAIHDAMDLMATWAAVLEPPGKRLHDRP
jgi:DNA-binding GntR family transcriptional regulator